MTKCLKTSNEIYESGERVKNLYRKFKELTGLSYSDLGERLGVTKQNVEYSLRNHSITYINANKWAMTQAIDEAIEVHKKQISELEALKREVKEFKSEKSDCDGNK